MGLYFSRLYIVKDEIIHPARRATDEFRIRLDSEYYVCLKTINKDIPKTKYKK